MTSYFLFKKFFSPGAIIRPPPQQTVTVQTYTVNHHTQQTSSALPIVNERYQQQAQQVSNYQPRLQQGHINPPQQHIQYQLQQQQQRTQYQTQPQRQQLFGGNRQNIYQQQAPRVYQQPTFRQPATLPSRATVALTRQPQIRHQQPPIRQPIIRPSYGRSLSRDLMRMTNNILSSGTDYAPPEADFSMFGGENMGSELCLGGDMGMGTDFMGGDFMGGDLMGGGFDFDCSFE